jgi:hypothetical protein
MYIYYQKLYISKYIHIIKMYTYYQKLYISKYIHITKNVYILPKNIHINIYTYYQNVYILSKSIHIIKMYTYYQKSLHFIKMYTYYQNVCILPKKCTYYQNIYILPYSIYVKKSTLFIYESVKVGLVCVQGNILYVILSLVSIYKLLYRCFRPMISSRYRSTLPSNGTEFFWS